MREYIKRRWARLDHPAYDAQPWTSSSAFLAFSARPRSVLGLARDNWMARRIGEETGSRIVPPQPEDPVILLEKLYELRQSGAITEEEYEAQKSRILGDE